MACSLAQLLTYREVCLCCLDLRGCAGCSSCGAAWLVRLSCKPAYSATALVYHLVRSVDSTTRSGAGSQLSQDCSAPWQENDRSQRLSISPRKSYNDCRDVTWINSRSNSLGGDRGLLACKYHAHAMRLAVVKLSPLFSCLLALVYPPPARLCWWREPGGGVVMGNLHGKQEVGFLLPKPCGCSPLGSYEQGRRQASAHSHFWGQKQGHGTKNLPLHHQILVLDGHNRASPEERQAASPSIVGAGRGHGCLLGAASHGRVNLCWGRNGPTEPNCKYICVLLLPATHLNLFDPL